ncbi:MAG: ShlB/FhaC/HecB family hemolysin secretion/activation protein, partial [Pseudomonadota bacterium]
AALVVLLATAAPIPDAGAQVLPRAAQPTRPLPPPPTPGEDEEPGALAPAPGGAAPGGAAPALRPPATARPGSFLLREVAFEGNTVFDADTLRGVVAALIGRAITIDDLEAARIALTRYYTDRGYVSSGVTIPLPQDVTAGTVRFRVIEGRLTDIAVSGEGVADEGRRPGELSADVVRRRLALDQDVPLRLDLVQDRFGLLLQDPTVRRLDGRLVPGGAPGETRLEVLVEPAPPVELTLGFDNFDPPSTGVYRGLVDVRFNNIAGVGDVVRLGGEVSRGRQSGDLDLTSPLHPLGLRVFAGATITRTQVIEEPFDTLDIESDFVEGRVGLAFDALSTPSTTLTLDAGLSFARSETRLLGTRFSFSPGVQDGVARGTVLRIGQTVLHRRDRVALSLRSTVSVGLGIAGATENGGDVPDSQFVSWLGQAFVVGRVHERATLSLSASAQVANDALLPFEEVGLGGADTVRGFRETAVAEPNVAFARLGGEIEVVELALPGRFALGEAPLPRPVTFEPFVSAGIAWPDDGFEDRTLLVGAGADFRWSPTEASEVTVGVGVPVLSDSPLDDDDLRDLRTYVSLSLSF